jgi:hypothetical protein
MKKQYITPKVSVNIVVTEQVMTQVSASSLNGVTVGGEATGEEEVDARWFEHKNVWDD